MRAARNRFPDTLIRDQKRIVIHAFGRSIRDGRGERSVSAVSGSFEIRHIATLCKYAGISFISGAVNHGMFSGERSLLTAALGVVIYVGGAALFRFDGSEKTSWNDLLGYGVLASVGLGFFTGGLQHFPDSPDRSLWVVPTGFVMSLVAFHALEGRATLSRAGFLRFGALGTATVVAASIVAWWIFNHLGHGHGPGHTH